MKNLLYKEFRLAIHPSVYVFFLLSALLLVPSYPYYVSFFYLTLGLFLTFKTNRAENDIFYSALLPVRKGDVVRARVLAAALLELANILIAVPFAVLSVRINPVGGNNAGIEPNVAFFGLSMLMYGGFNLIFFPVFYKTGRSEGKAFLWAVCSCSSILSPPKRLRNTSHRRSARTSTLWGRANSSVSSRCCSPGSFSGRRLRFSRRRSAPRGLKRWICEADCDKYIAAAALPADV